MEFSVCIDALFQGKDFCESLKTVKAANINSFEFWSWWDKDISKIKKAKDELDMNVAAFCTKFVSLVDASKREEYTAGLRASIDVAKELSCNILITQVSNELQNIPREIQRKNLTDGLKACAPILEEEGITLVIEPLNTYVDHRGYYLYSSAEAFEIIDEVASVNIKVLFDIYHQQIMEGNLINNITKNIDIIGHFHAAGIPGRKELTSGEVNYVQVFKAIHQAGFTGYLGLEYFPLEDAVIDLKNLNVQKLHSLL